MCGTREAFTDHSIIFSWCRMQDVYLVDPQQRLSATCFLQLQIQGDAADWPVAALVCAVGNICTKPFALGLWCGRCLAEAPPGPRVPQIDNA